MAQVALFTRAWIEMITNDSNTLSITSPSSRGRGLKFEDLKMRGQVLTVALFTRAWIEIAIRRSTSPKILVALFTRAWIEIYPSARFNSACSVALFTRAWIEIGTANPMNPHGLVALFTRAWIEIAICCAAALSMKSPSSRGRGLKLLG